MDTLLMARQSHSHFKSFIDGACVALTGRPASTHKAPRHQKLVGANCVDFWQTTNRTDGTSRNSLLRNKAYLSAYFFISGGKIPTTGILLDDKTYIHPDKSVIERSLRDGHVAISDDGNYFELTNDGFIFLGRL